MCMCFSSDNFSSLLIIKLYHYKVLDEQSSEDLSAYKNITQLSPRAAPPAECHSFVPVMHRLCEFWAIQAQAVAKNIILM